MKNGRFSGKNVSKSEIHHGRVHLYLAEVRIDGARQGEVGRQEIPEVRADAVPHRVPLGKRVRGIGHRPMGRDPQGVR
jgi:hypothetical protein